MTVVPPRSARATVALDGLERLAAGSASPPQAIQDIVRRIAGVIDSDVYFAAAVDPKTRLCLGVAAHNLDEQLCYPAFEHEFLVPDYNKFMDLTASHPVADLRLATGGKLSRSPRYRLHREVADLEDELRLVLHAGGQSWGHLQLNRHTGDKPFTDTDRAFLSIAAPLAGAALRQSVLAAPAGSGSTRGPGVLIVDQTGTIISATAEADAWLAELTGEPGRRSTHVGLRRDLLLMPLTAWSGPGASPQRARLRTPGGTWLTAYASPLGDSGHVSIVIERAKAAEIAPVVVAAYHLTDREVQVAHLIARGLGTDEIAAELFLSRHTVRDHLKAIFGKVGVSSRGELTSVLFSEQYRGLPTGTMHTSPGRVPASAELARDSADCRR